MHDVTAARVVSLQSLDFEILWLVVGEGERWDWEEEGIAWIWRDDVCFLTDCKYYQHTFHDVRDRTHMTSMVDGGRWSQKAIEVMEIA